MDATTSPEDPTSVPDSNIQHLGKHLCVDTSKQRLTRFDLILLETFQGHPEQHQDNRRQSCCGLSYSNCSTQGKGSFSTVSSTSSSSLNSALTNFGEDAKYGKELLEDHGERQVYRNHRTDLLHGSKCAEEEEAELCCEKDSGSESLPPEVVNQDQEEGQKDGYKVNGRSVSTSVSMDHQSMPAGPAKTNNWRANKSGSVQTNSSSSGGAPTARSANMAAGSSSTGNGIASAAVQLLNGMLSLPPSSSSPLEGSNEGYRNGSLHGSQHPGQATTPMPTKMPHQRLVRRHSTFQPDKISAPCLAVNGSSLLQSNAHHQSEGGEFVTNLALQHQHSTSAGDSATARLMRDLLVGHASGLEMAFDRCKAWSKYAAHLLSFVRNRLNLEHDHQKACQKLAEQTKAMLAVDANNNFLPLVNIFDELMEGAIQFTNRADQTIAMLHQRFISTLENRQKEHDMKRRKLKADWSKQRKLLDVCAEELRRSRQNLNAKEGAISRPGILL
uniref:IMD domain-containing protein n=1 Tax=Ditylenchus dipsaci TaxID=166011 RepID=A0A915EU12_9BILA